MSHKKGKARTLTKEDMNMKRKMIAAILTLALVISCTAAFAEEARQTVCNGQKFAHGMHRMHKTAMSQEAKAQFDKLCKLKQKFGEEMKKETPDKAEAMKLKAEIEDIKLKMAQKRFEKMLANPNFGKRKAKLTEAQKARMEKMHELREAIRKELGSDNPDKVKAAQLNKEMLELKKEASMERFAKVMENPKKFAEQRKNHKFGKKHRGHGMRGCGKQKHDHQFKNF